MHLFIPYCDAISGENALHEARRVARPGDHVTVMVPVIVPAGLPVDVGAGAIWKQACQAERRLFHARVAAERILPCIALRFVRVQARNRAAAIRVGATQYEADVILLGSPPGLRGALVARFGTTRALARNAPCPVRIIGSVPITDHAAPHRAPEPVWQPVESLTSLRVIATNPEIMPPSRGGTYRV
mgnify:CR=1 FL=1